MYARNQPTRRSSRLTAVGDFAAPSRTESTEPTHDLMRMPETPFQSIQKMSDLVSAGASDSVDSHTSETIDASRGSGSPLPESTRNFMESRFATDFSNVRIHTGAEPERLSKDLNAQAFTVGSDIYFNTSKFSPESSDGKRLLAHELAHTVQQSGAAHRKILRVVDDASVEAEFQAWATKAKEKVNKSSSDYPQQLWTFISTLIMDTTTFGPIAKPTDKAKLAEWNANWEKAAIIADWLTALRSSSKSDDVKAAADSRAHGILDFMVQAGLVTTAMSHASGISDEKKKSLYETILKNPGAASVTELETITAFQCNGVKDAASVPIVQSLTDKNATPIKQLDADRTKGIFKVLIINYPSSGDIVEALAQVLTLNPKIRKPISDAMMASTIGSPDLLFKVLKSPYFIEPGYEGATQLTSAIPSGMSSDDYEKKRMKDDMPWVYTYKQKYYVQYLIDMAKSQSIVIASPTKMDVPGLRSWLETNTENIGLAASKKYPSDPKAVLDIYKNIADIFFFHIPHDRDVKPDLEGKISHLVPGEPSKMRFEADCDVFATYAMRLFFNAGFEPIGYMAYVPTGADSARAAHVSALMRKSSVYYVINNKGILDPGITETKTDEKKTDALKKMHKIAVDDAYNSPIPATMDIFYADAEAKGKMPKLFLAQDKSLLRTDL